MSLTRSQIKGFYEGVDYWPAEKIPYRPRELNIPLVFSELYEDGLAGIPQDKHKIVFELDSNRCEYIAPVMLHESIFRFYKGFYNYLAARSLYFGGMLHWVNISLYYARFFLAKSVTVLAGKHDYKVAKNHHFFIKDIADLLTGDKPYSMHLEVDMNQKIGKIICDKERINSHRDVWRDYSKLNVENFGLYCLIPRVPNEKGELNIDFLSEERNRENYSFDGYMQLDFNLQFKPFQQYFERDRIKNDANKIFDFTSSDVLQGFSSQFGLYKEFKIKYLPIEKEKFSYMIDYCLPESEAKEHLLRLCEEEFPTRGLYSVDGDEIYDDLGRYL